MKKKQILCIVFLLVFLLQLAIPVHANSNLADLSVSNGCNTIDGQNPLLGSMQLVTNARAVFLYEMNTDTVMHAWNADLPLYPASFVKIMTALIVLEQGNLSDIVTVSQEVLNTVAKDAMSVDLVANEILSVEDLLYCMMVGSANDAAAVLADHLKGSQDAFVTEMNRYAEKLGCTNTHYTNPHGLHHEEQLSTARDTCRILTEAMKNETFREIFQTVYYSVPATNKSDSRLLSTSNYLIVNDDMIIYYDGRVIGGRTGETTDGERCVAAVAQQEDMQLLSIIMGSKSVYEEDGFAVKVFGGFSETTQLLDLGFNGYETAQILYSNQAVKQYSVSGGDGDVFVAPSVSLSAVVPTGTRSDQLQYHYNDIGSGFSAPLEQGQHLSNLEVWYGSVCLATADLYAMNKVEAVEIISQERAVNIFSLDILTDVLIVVLCIFIGLFLLLFVIRSVNRARYRGTSRRNRINRRRSR